MSSFGVIEKIKTIDNIIVNKEHLSNNMNKIFISLYYHQLRKLLSVLVICEYLTLLHTTFFRLFMERYVKYSLELKYILLSVLSVRELSNRKSANKNFNTVREIIAVIDM